ncbi:hypothetical protein [Nesterenkonia pannonica]|nr:phosphatase PAP2 family protein [Nesterenkonia pannonica]
MLPGEAIRRILAALMHAGAALLCFAYFVGTPTGQALDNAGLGMDLVGMPEAERLQLFDGVRVGAVLALAVLACALGLWALLRRRAAAAAVLALAAVGVVVLAGALRRALMRPELVPGGYDYNTWPSGHVAAACALAVVCLRLLPPGRLRPAAALVAATAVAAASYASATTFAHRPSDTIGGVLLCGAVMALCRAPGRRLRSTWWAWTVTLIIGLASAALLILGPALDPPNAYAWAALGWAAAMGCAACAVLLPESAAPGVQPASPRLRRGDAAASA